MRCAEKHDLFMKPQPDDPDLVYISAIPGVRVHLAKTCNAVLFYHMPFTVTGQTCMFALYSNYTMERYQLCEQDEKEVIEILQKELGIIEDPMWYWDRCHNPW